MGAIYGWVGKLLWVDLSSGRIWETETGPYAKDFIGGRGVAAKLMWDITSADPSAKPLIFMTGPLGATIAPFGGRTVVAGYAPQGYPHEWYSRSTFGAYWAAELKYAGYDGLIILGEAARPVYLWIHNGEVELRKADFLWGKGNWETQLLLKDRLGPQVRIASIGQAGENGSRIAVIQTETESAAGQGGFGAVMGRKRLKAIAVRGTGVVRVAHPALLMRCSKAIRDELRFGSIFSRDAKLDPDKVQKYGERWYACTQQCGVHCVASRHYSNVPGPITGQQRGGVLHCTSPGFAGRGKGSFYDWDIGFEAGFELACMANDFGINHWDLHFGIIPWLRHCQRTGRTKLDGIKIDVNDPGFWAYLLRKIAYREGIGDVIAEGGYRAAKELGWEEDFIEELYAAWGYAGHWDGHGDRVNRIVFPFWLVPGLQWAVDTRDPISSSHGYAHASMLWSPLRSTVNVGSGREAGAEEGKYLSWAELKELADRVYGTADALDPHAEYKGKAHAAVWHANRSAIKDSLLVCDWMFPCLFSLNQPDLWARADDMEGVNFEWHLFTATTGIEMSKEEFYKVGERICNLERALQVRDFGRSRADDEKIIPYLEREEWWPNPLFDNRRVGADASAFRALLDEFYRLRGWSVETGRPTRAVLERLALEEVAKVLEEHGLI